LAAEALAVVDTPLLCPSCQPNRRLSSRQVAGYAVLECKVCGGFWVDNDVLQHLVDRAARLAERIDDRRRTNLAGKQAVAGGELQPGASKPHGYLPCPVCHERMMHQNFGHRSGVVIDVCNHDGVWFDANKLPRLLDWVRAGGRPEPPARQTAYELAKSAELQVRTSKNGGLAGDEEIHAVAQASTRWGWLDRLLIDLFF
jgi:Zn-finger nucleic acid-binding protein